jgi:hypothetical protein
MNKAKGSDITWKDCEDAARNHEDLGRGSYATGTTRCYQVQAKASKGCTKEANLGNGRMAIITDSEWTTLYFSDAHPGCPGVPKSNGVVDEYADHGYLSYPAAQAMRWWWIANCGLLTFFDTRLVEFEFRHAWTATPVAAHCLLVSEKRENILPDWGKPKAQPQNEETVNEEKTPESEEKAQ